MRGSHLSKKKHIRAKRKAQAKEFLVHFLKVLRKPSFLLLPLWFLDISLLLLCIVLFARVQQVRIVSVPSSFDTKVAAYPFLKEGINPPLSAASVVVLERDSRVVVFEKNPHFRFSPASTVKLMTALVALEAYSPDTVLISDGLRKEDGSHMGLLPHENIHVLNLLYGLLLPSGNDAASVLAASYPGGVEKFVERMNQKAAELHLTNTHFIDASGYEDGNYTTAYDLALLTSYTLENPLLAQIVATKEKVVFDASQKIPHRLANLNKLLGHEGVLGVKTGFTHEAGEVLVTSYVHERKTYIVVVLKSMDRFGDTQTIIEEVIHKIQLLRY